MADCNETIRELYTFLDGELPDEVAAHIHEHLQDCGDCLEAFDFEAELKSAIRIKCSNDELPTGLVERLELCLQQDFNDDDIIGRPSPGDPTDPGSTEMI